MLLTPVLSLLLVTAAPPDAPTDVERQQANHHVREARRLMASEAFAEAAQEFRRAIKLNPYLTVAHYGLGQAHMALREYDGAVKAFEKAREVFHEVAGDAALRQLESDKVRDDRIRDLRDAINELRARQVAPNSPEAMRREMRIQQWEVEISMLERVRGAEAVPRTPPEMSLALGSAYFRSGRLADAEREYRAALEVSPKMGESRNNLAVVLLLSGRASEAQEQILLAEKAGFKVAPGLKKDVEKALAAVRPQ